MRKLKRNCWIFLSFLSFCCSSIFGTELDPWFSEPYVFFLRGNFTLERYHKVNTAFGNQSYTAYNHFLDRSIEFCPSEDLSFELEWEGCSTRNTTWNVEFIRLTGRYLILDDVGGLDYVSLAVGVTETLPWRMYLRDVSLFHHSLYDTELHLSIGKEFACGSRWAQRAWLLCGFGLGTRGNPWIHSIANIEFNYCDIHHFRFGLDFLRGLGTNSITSLKPFPGYAGIAHQSFDFIFDYTMIIPTYFDIHIGYLQRIAARNCPVGVQGAMLGITFAIGL